MTLAEKLTEMRNASAAADFDPDYTKRPEPSKTVDDLRKLKEFE